MLFISEDDLKTRLPFDLLMDAIQEGFKHPAEAPKRLHYTIPVNDGPHGVKGRSWA